VTKSNNDKDQFYFRIYILTSIITDHYSPIIDADSGYFNQIKLKLI